MAIVYSNSKTELIDEKNGIAYTNIHYYPNHYQRNLTLKPAEKNSFSQIKSRYLATMKEQLIRQNPTQKNELADIFLNDKKFEEFEAQLEKDWVEEHERVAQQYRSNFNVYVQNIKNTSNKTQALQEVERLQKYLTNHQQQIGQLKQITKGKNVIQQLTVNQLLDIGKFKDSLNDGPNFSKTTLSSLLATPTEGMEGIILTKMDQIGGQAIVNTVKSNPRVTLTGNSPNKATVKLGNEEIEVSDKAADFKQEYKYITDKITITENGIERNLSIDVTTYGQVKTYNPDNSTLSLTSSGGKHSLLMSTLRSLYGTSPGTNYIIYNTLVYSKGDLRDQNFRIIRSDLIARTAELYISGMNTDTAQRVFIYNFKAYPMLSILSAIIDEATNKNGPYGSISSGDSFSLSIYRSNVKNEWVGSEEKNLLNKIERIKKVKQAMEKVTVQGKLNFKNLEAHVKKMRNDGIALDWLYDD